MNIWELDLSLRMLLFKMYVTQKDFDKVYLKSKSLVKPLIDSDWLSYLLKYTSFETIIATKLQNRLDIKYLVDINSLNSTDNLRMKIWSKVRYDTGTHHIPEVMDFIVQILESSERHTLELERFRKNTIKAKDEIRLLNSKNRILNTSMKSLKAEVKALNVKINSKTSTDSSYKELKEEVAKRKSENNHLQYLLSARNESYEKLKSRHKRLMKELFNTSNQNSNSSGCMKQPKVSFGDDECVNCDNFDLCLKKILIVGGIDRMVPHYKQTIEDMGGEVRFHTGKNRSMGSSFLSLVKWADIVLCPVSVNSHNACLQAKKECKRLDKEFVWLPSTGISAIKKTLTAYN